MRRVRALSVALAVPSVSAERRRPFAPGAGGGPHVQVFTGDGAPLGPGFLANDGGFTGGVTVAGPR